MKLTKFLKITIALLLLFAVSIALISFNHPIVLKWVTGSARIVGKSITATVYTNGRINHDIKVFHVDKHCDGTDADYYILYISYIPDPFSKLKFFIVSKKYNYAGRPVGTGIRDYDFITGYLF